MTRLNLHRFSLLFALSIATWQIAALTTPSRAAELLGYWALEETDVGEDAVDSSGNGWNGIYEGEADPNVEGAPGFGSGVMLDGFDGRILIGPGDENGFGDLTEDFSVMAWIKPDQFDSKNRVFGSAPWQANSGWGWGTVGDQLEITTWGVKDYDQPVPLDIEEWAHVAIVLDDEFSAHFYHNGEFVGTQLHGAGGGPTFNDFYIGYAAVEVEHFSGYLDEVAVFEGVLSDEQIVNAMTLGVLNFDGVGLRCDFDGDGSLGEGDINLLSSAIATGDMDPKFDANDDGAVNVDDLNFLVTDQSKLHTWMGDANLDSEFNSGDLVSVFAAGKYEVVTDATWGEGDWNADLRFSSGDLVAAFTDGGYELGPRGGEAAAAVPEPSAVGLMLIGIGWCLIRWRRRSA